MQTFDGTKFPFRIALEAHMGLCYGMALARFVDGGDGLQMWRVTENILNLLNSSYFK